MFSANDLRENWNLYEIQNKMNERHIKDTKNLVYLNILIFNDLISFLFFKFQNYPSKGLLETRLSHWVTV